MSRNQVDISTGSGPTLPNVPRVRERFLPSGEEAGTSPGDRRFRPDVEGLRAVAVLLVVLFHAGVPGLSGGYIGVDVFFVISGFVITGLLLRERLGTGRTSVVDFYARRCRRILPAATLVILTTMLASYVVLGAVTGNSVADDGRWAAAFLANFHFEASGTNYLSASLPPSPLQNYWSLSVEEQFYVVYPTLFLLVTRARGWLSLRARLAATLGVIIVASLWLSVAQTASQPTVAYFSPFTRAWELALGGLVAVATPWLKNIPRRIAAVATWSGLGAIAAATLIFDAHSPYPGALVAVPVFGAGLIIAGGVAIPPRGAEAVLGLHPLQWLGRRSYSLYLWHWPILIIAAERVGKSSLPVGENLVLVLLAMAVSTATYRLVENPVRHLSFASRHRWASIALGLGLTAMTIGVATAQIHSHSGTGVAATTRYSASPSASLETVRRLVATATQIRTAPANLTPAVTSAFSDFGIPSTWTGCSATYGQANVPACTFGDPHGTHTMVLYGDSHALMWAQALDDVAIKARWRFVLLAKSGCPVGLVPIGNPAGYGAPGGEWSACDQWRRNASGRINRIDPDLMVVAQANRFAYPPRQWQLGLERALRAITSPMTTRVVLGDIPRFPQSVPDCLARHAGDVQACSIPTDSTIDNRPLMVYYRTERAAAAAVGARYVSVTPWFCSRTCTPIIGHYEVYKDDNHVTNTYARFLEGVLAEALQLPSLAPLPPPKPDPHTTLLIPVGGAVASGTTLLDASTADNVGVTKVEFRLTGSTAHDTLISVGKDTLTPTLAGWVGYWNTATVTNGNYVLQSIVYDAAGKTARSKAIPIVVRN